MGGAGGKQACILGFIPSSANDPSGRAGGHFCIKAITGSYLRYSNQTMTLLLPEHTCTQIPKPICITNSSSIGNNIRLNNSLSTYAHSSYDQVHHNIKFITRPTAIQENLRHPTEKQPHPSYYKPNKQTPPPSKRNPERKDKNISLPRTPPTLPLNLPLPLHQPHRLLQHHEIPLQHLRPVLHVPEIPHALQSLVDLLLQLRGLAC